jgi:hypothetical protein
MKTLLLLCGAAMLALGVTAAVPAAEADYYGNVPPHRGYYGNVPRRGAYHHYQPRYNYRPYVYWLGYYYYPYPYSYGYIGPRRGFQERRYYGR